MILLIDDGLVMQILVGEDIDAFFELIIQILECDLSRLVLSLLFRPSLSFRF